MKNTLNIITLAITVSALAFSSAGGKQSASDPPEQVSFSTKDGGLIYAHLYGKGDQGVVLAHGGRFNKESWEKQARALAKADSAFWLSISAASANRKAPARPIFSAPHFTSTCWPRSATCERRAQRPCPLSGEVLEERLPPTRRLRPSRARLIA